jgi:hypothetical protein
MDSASTKPSAKGLPLLELAGACTLESATYEYIVLVTSLPYEVASISELYREKANTENPFDELRNICSRKPFTQISNDLFKGFGRVS